MSQLLEILGRAITVDTSDLILHWLKAVIFSEGDEESAQRHHLDAVIKLMRRRKTDAAAEQLRIYLFENPSCVYGRMAAAAICLHNNQLNDAIKELNSVYMRRPNNTMALYALGYCYERLGKESQAVEFYQDCIKFKRHLQLPAQRLAAIYFKNMQYEKTIEQYRLLNEEYPDDISTLVTLGHLYIITGKYAKATDTFNMAILMHPDNFSSQDSEVDQLIVEGRLHEAFEYIEELLQIEVDRPDLLLKQADILKMLGSTEDSISYYEHAINVCPDFLEATIKLGTQYLQLQQDHHAAALFNRAVEINDKIIDAYIGLSISQKMAGNLTDALGTLSLAAAIQPNSSLLFSEMAYLCFKQSELNCISDFNNPAYLSDAVIATHFQEISHRPQNPDLYYRLGILMMGAGRILKAIEAFQTSLSINPLFTRARSKLAVCFYQIDRKPDSLNILNDYDCLDRGTLELHYQTSLLYCDKLKFASSLINLERFMDNNFACTDVSVNISVVLQNLGLLDRVTAMWDNISDMAGHTT
ncbi:MAG: tetratricopeptide repeat protein [Sedimentisphaerales bacterium]|nr:tetratricopeptide repeat protein [Sedimentisphaerales bacterium]